MYRHCTLCLNIAVQQYLLQNVKATLQHGLQRWVNIEIYLPYRGWESFYSCWGISICALWTWINSCWFRIHEERLQHISASQQGLSLALLLALFCLCFTCLTNESTNSCRCSRSPLVCVGLVPFPKKVQEDRYIHTQLEWGLKGKLFCTETKWISFFLFSFWKRKILRRTNSFVAQSPNSIS